MKIIVLELNEVPHKVLKKFSFTKLAGRYESDYHKTISMDSGHLSPWITWATVHRGVNNSEHGINDINQCTNTIDEKYPTIFSKCIDNGLSVGLVNTMHSGRLAYKQNRKYTFLLPEAFASNKFCIPSSLEDFQTFNLLMSRGSSRSVSRSLPRKINFLKVLSIFSSFFSAGFYYKIFIKPRFAWKYIYEPFIRLSAGLGKPPRNKDGDKYD